MIRRGLGAALLVVAAWAIGLVPCASAANPPPLGQSPEDGIPGSSAGRLDAPYGIAADSATGHIYVSDSRNNRVSEFTAWGDFVKAFGWGVSNGSPELQVCTATCQAGLAGDGAGQLDNPGGIVTDTAGDIYVVDTENLRVVKFSSAGEFLLTFGYKVNETTEANVCTAADVQSGDQCGAGEEGTEPTQFRNWFFYTDGRAIAAAPSGDVYVGDNGRVQVFGSNGGLKEAIDFSEVTGLPEGIAKSITITPDGNLYIAFFQDYNSNGPPKTPDVYVVDPDTKALFGKLKVDFPKLLSADASGSVYVVAEAREPMGGTEGEKVVVFDSSGDCVICLDDDFDFVDGFFETQITSIATGNACGPTDIYVGHGNPRIPGEDGFRSQIVIYGSPPDSTICPPPPIPPTIKDQFALGVGSESATVKAAINPHFWPDTAYYVEYGLEDCAVSTCLSQPLPPGTSLGGQVTNTPVLTAGTFLHGLQPDQTYHYRFVTQSGGGGPAIGPDSTFTTFPVVQRPADSCPNAPFRVGLAAALPDCRAYEMVSPLDKEGGDILALKNVFGYEASLNQSDTAGERITYSSAKSFGDAKSAPYASQYMATRQADGWSTQSISPPRNGPILERGQTTDTEYKAFTDDLCQAWLRHDTDPPLAEGAPQGFASLYRRENCAGGSFEALRTPPPPSTPAVNYEPEFQGYSDDGSRAIFVAGDKLTTDAPADSSYLLYESRSGETEPRYVCILPNGGPDTGGCSAGTNNPGGGFGRAASVQGAMSEDGTRIYWSNTDNGPGKIFLRLDGTETVAISAFAEGKEKTTSSQFWAAAADGSRAIFMTGDDLYEYDAELFVSRKIASGVAGLMGVSQDAREVYFVSDEALEGAAVAGKPNLYRASLEGEAWTVEFIVEVSTADAQPSTLQQIPSPISKEPVKHSARVSPDGQHLAFMSTMRPTPTGYDNSDAATGKPAAEVYLYDADSGELHCVSCNRSGGRPRAEELEVGGFKTGLWAAGELPTWENQLYAPRVLSDDGNRLFFESADALVPGDTNAKKDVYQWERPGTGGCGTGTGSYIAQTGGCVDLISSGESSFKTEFVDATPLGNDVFIGTLASLVPQDYGLVDIYDVRVSGGFEPSPPPWPECEGTACQSPPAPPPAPTPASANFVGPGSPPQKAGGRRCPKGKRLVKRNGKTKCVKKAKGKSHKKQRRSGRAGR
jgi:DNA-binding beta-propeller fold protein YncE